MTISLSIIFSPSIFSSPIHPSIFTFLHHSSPLPPPLPPPLSPPLPFLPLPFLPLPFLLPSPSSSPPFPPPLPFLFPSPSSSLPLPGIPHVPSMVNMRRTSFQFNIHLYTVWCWQLNPPTFSCSFSFPPSTPHSFHPLPSPNPSSFHSFLLLFFTIPSPFPSSSLSLPPSPLLPLPSSLSPPPSPLLPLLSTHTGVTTCDLA